MLLLLLLLLLLPIALPRLEGGRLPLEVEGEGERRKEDFLIPHYRKFCIYSGNY